MTATDDRKKRLNKQLAEASELLKWCIESESAKRINAALDLARSEPGIPVLPEQLDRDPWLFNCANGTIELKTGSLREHRRSDMLTKLCPTPYDPDATCPTWLRFLSSVFAGDDSLILFVQRLLGCCLSGDVSEQVLPIFWGCGANGKSTLVNAVMETVGGDYAMKTNQDFLMVHRGERHLTEKASLFGMRLVVASETSQGGKLNEVLVKDLTGGEPVRCRRMREDEWQFEPTHKLILLTNHKPKVTGADHAMWRRLRLVPFEVTFWNPDDAADNGEEFRPELRQDKKLPGKLRVERPGILAWMVRGCLDWQRDGLSLPQKVKVATAEYRSAEDAVQQFIIERCIIGGPDFRCRSADLYAAYKCWCEANGEEAYSQRVFGEQMTARGVKRMTSNGTWYVGVVLRQDEE